MNSGIVYFVLMRYSRLTFIEVVFYNCAFITLNLAPAEPWSSEQWPKGFCCLNQIMAYSQEKKKAKG